MAGTSTPSSWQVVSGLDQQDLDRRIRDRRRLYGTTTLLLTIVMALVAIDGVGALDIVGVDSSWSRATGGGYELGVRHGTVTRPALATPFDIEIVRDGGFDGPVTVAVTSEYLSIWDENGLSPTPTAETTDGEWVIWEFDPPPGDTLLVSFDARIEPAAQSGKSGRAAVLVDGQPVVEVGFRTRVLP